MYGEPLTPPDDDHDHDAKPWVFDDAAVLDTNTLAEEIR